MSYKLYKLSNAHLNIDDIDRVFYFVLMLNGNHDYINAGRFIYFDGVFYREINGAWTSKFMKWEGSSGLLVPIGVANLSEFSKPSKQSDAIKLKIKKATSEICISMRGRRDMGTS
jgi:hypothetical protein